MLGALLSCAMAAGQDKTQAPTISVSGNGEVAVRPDHSVVRLGVVSRGATAAEAQSASNNVADRMIKAIAALGIKKEDIQTSNLMLNPVYEQPMRDVPRIVGYEARNSLSVMVRDLSLVGKVADVGLASGANVIEGISFGLHEDGEARKKALRLAVASARDKAAAIAEAADVGLLSIVEIQEGGSYSPPVPMMEARMAMSSPTPVEPGQIVVSASVSIKFSFRPKV